MYRFNSRSRFLLLLILFSVASRSNGQGTMAKPTKGPVGTVIYLTPVDPRFNIPVEFEVLGSPYDNDSPMEATIFFTHQNPAHLKLRYNIYSDWMEYQKSDSIYGVLPDKFIKKITLGSKTFVVEEIEVKKKNAFSYFQQLDSGKLTLLSKLNVTFRDRQQGKPIEGDKPAKYTRQRDTFYLRAGSGPLTKIQSAQQIIDAYDGDKIALEAFLKKEKIGVTKADDVIQLIRYCNSH
jgi:hypothetical protein